ncbi:MAG: precorrin-6A reductase [Selenomonadaceae bacterium]|nr:precorrin-6A reductase [Selenomonadaceae bacterium]MBR6905682.1 precorrin-6A reductase [Selenomonadaceae bacterium]
MIFVAAGTRDGRELVKALLDAGHAVVASVVSRYGAELLEQYGDGRLVVNDKPLDEDAMMELFRHHHIRLMVDASHPYAENVSRNAMAACRRAGIPYLRYERPGIPIAYEKVYRVQGYEEAARQAAALGKHVFLTTGSRNLRAFTESPDLRNCVLTARVLPSAEVLAECARLGLSPKQIVAMQGPFSQKLNEELFRQYEAEVIVTKNGGQIGGADTKFAAAEALGLPVVLIERPAIEYAAVAGTFAEVLEFVGGL